jgi:hypothetical protein
MKIVLISQHVNNAKRFQKKRTYCCCVDVSLLWYQTFHRQSEENRLLMVEAVHNLYHDKLIS